MFTLVQNWVFPFVLFLIVIVFGRCHIKLSQIHYCYFSRNPHSNEARMTWFIFFNAFTSNVWTRPSVRVRKRVKKVNSVASVPYLLIDISLPEREENTFWF